MRICYIGRLDFPDGLGGTRRFYDIFGRMTELGHHVEFVNLDFELPTSLKDALLRFNWENNESMIKDIVVHKLSREISAFSQPLSAGFYTAKLIRRQNIGVLVLQMPEPHAGIPALIASELTGTPLVVDYPDSNYRAPSNSRSVVGDLSARVEWCIAQRADLVLPISETMDRELLSDLPDHKKHVLRPGIQYEKIAAGTPDDSLVPDGFVVGYLGSYAEREGVVELLDAVELLRDDIQEIQLVMAGGVKGPNSDFIKESVTSDMEGHVTEIDFIEHDRLPDFMASCDVLCAPQRDTFGHRVAFSTKVCEFLASPTPVVTTSVGDLGEMLEDRRHAVVIKPQEVNDLREGIRKLYENPEQRIEVGISGQELAKNELNANVQRRTAENLLSQQISRP